MTSEVKRSDASTEAGGSVRERGVALLVVLWIIVAAVLLVSSFNAAVGSGASFVAAELKLAQAEALLDAGAEIAAAHLIEKTETRRWLPDGGKHSIAFAGAELTITIVDPNGLIDLNKSDETLLLAFFHQSGGSNALATQIRDNILQARDDVGGKETRSGSPRASGYEARSESDGPSDAIAFVDASQIRGLPGMTPDLYRQVAPFLTVYSRDGHINPLTAPKEVLLAIPNLTKLDVDRMREAQKGGATDDSALSDVMQRAGAYLTDESGPAYVVSVEVRQGADTHRARKVFVMVTGLDSNAPYRLIAKKPMTLAE